MQCWQCGREIVLQSAQKINTRDVCPQCDADLHACRNCRHFDPTAHNECREVMAEWVRYKERSNYCDYFSPAAAGTSQGAGGGKDNDAGNEARRRLDRLFGGS